MPGGDWAFLEGKGPRTKVTVRLSTVTARAMDVAGAELGLSRTGFLTLLAEGWADEWIARESGGASQPAPVQDQTATGQSVEGSE